MTVARYVLLKDVRRRPDARAISRENVEGLKASIREVGMLSPVIVRHAEGDSYELIAGNHRFIAVQELGELDIMAIDLADLDDLKAELAMIDENLRRADPSAAERSVQVARRKAIYLELHPETAAHVAGAHASNRAQGNASANFAPAFTTETAAAIGRSERAVQLDAERGEKVIPEVLDMIRGTKLDTGTYLDKIKKLPPNEQVHVARRDLAVASRPPEPKAPGGSAVRAEPKPEPTYEQLREAIQFLSELKPADFTHLCPPNKRAAMCQKLSHLERVFEQVREAASA